jgi:hypothetical protein
MRRRLTLIRDVLYAVNVLRNGALYASLRWDTSSVPNVYSDKNGTIKSSMGGTFLYNPNVDYLSDELQPTITINGKETPLGVYRITTYRDVIDETGHWVQIEAYDRSWKVKTVKTESIIHFSVGQSYITIVQQLLAAAGIGTVLATPSDAVLQTDREDWAAGTDYLTICNALLAEINYNPLWFDANGTARVEPHKAPSADNIVWQYSKTDIRVRSPIRANISQEHDIFSAPNVFVVVCSNPDLEEPMVARAENNSPSSSISIFRRGQRITQYSKVDNIASQSALQEYVDNLRNQSLLGTRTITFHSLNEPGHGVGDIIAIDHPNVGGIYEETGWYIELKEGSMMKHTAKRAVIA